MTLLSTSDLFCCFVKLLTDTVSAALMALVEATSSKYK